MHKAVRSPGDVRHLTVPAVQLKFDRACTFGLTGDVLSFVEYPAVRQHGDGLMLGVSDGLAARSAECADRAGNLNFMFDCFDVLRAETKDLKVGQRAPIVCTVVRKDQ